MDELFLGSEIITWAGYLFTGTHFLPGDSSVFTVTLLDTA